MALMSRNTLLKVIFNRTKTKFRKSMEYKISSGNYLIIIFLEYQNVYMAFYTSITKINH